MTHRHSQTTTDRGLAALARVFDLVDPGPERVPWPDEWFFRPDHGADARLCRQMWGAVFLASLMDAVDEAARSGLDPPRIPPWINSTGPAEVASLAGLDGGAVLQRARAAFASRADVLSLQRALKPKYRMTVVKQKVK